MEIPVLSLHTDVGMIQVNVRQIEMIKNNPEGGVVYLAGNPLPLRLFPQKTSFRYLNMLLVFATQLFVHDEEGNLVKKKACVGIND